MENGKLRVVNKEKEQGIGEEEWRMENGEWKTGKEK